MLQVHIVFCDYFCCGFTSTNAKIEKYLRIRDRDPKFFNKVKLSSNVYTLPFEIPLTYTCAHPQTLTRYWRKHTRKNMIKTSAKLAKNKELETCFSYGRKMFWNRYDPNGRHVLNDPNGRHVLKIAQRMNVALPKTFITSSSQIYTWFKSIHATMIFLKLNS